jgi:hypothetical protein
VRRPGPCWPPDGLHLSQSCGGLKQRISLPDQISNWTIPTGLHTRQIAGVAIQPGTTGSQDARLRPGVGRYFGLTTLGIKPVRYPTFRRQFTRYPELKVMLTFAPSATRLPGRD